MESDEIIKESAKRCVAKGINKVMPFCCSRKSGKSRSLVLEIVICVYHEVMYTLVTWQNLKMRQTVWTGKCWHVTRIIESLVERYCDWKGRVVLESSNSSLSLWDMKRKVLHCTEVGKKVKPMNFKWLGYVIREPAKNGVIWLSQ